MEKFKMLNDIVKDNFNGFDFDNQLKIIYFYETQLKENSYNRNVIYRTLNDYVHKISTITLFKPNFKLLNGEGRKFIRRNLINQITSAGYKIKPDEEKYGLSQKQILRKYATFNAIVNTDHMLSKFNPVIISNEELEEYFRLFSELDYNVKQEEISSFCGKNSDRERRNFTDYMYPITMNDEFNEELKVLLLDYYSEYEKMTPDRRMEYVHDIVTNQFPRAFKYMDEIVEIRRNAKEKRNKVKSLARING